MSLPDPQSPPSEANPPSPPPRRPGEEVALAVAADAAGMRLDVFLARELPDCSRSFLARVIAQGSVRVDGVPARSSVKLRAGSVVVFTVPQPPRAGRGNAGLC